MQGPEKQKNSQTKKGAQPKFCWLALCIGRSTLVPYEFWAFADNRTHSTMAAMYMHAHRDVQQRDSRVLGYQAEARWQEVLIQKNYNVVRPGHDYALCLYSMTASSRFHASARSHACNIRNAALKSGTFEFTSRDVLKSGQMFWIRALVC